MKKILLVFLSILILISTFTLSVFANSSLYTITVDTRLVEYPTGAGIFNVNGYVYYGNNEEEFSKIAIGYNISSDGSQQTRIADTLSLYLPQYNSWYVIVDGVYEFEIHGGTDSQNTVFLKYFDPYYLTSHYIFGLFIPTYDTIYLDMGELYGGKYIYEFNGGYYDYVYIDSSNLLRSDGNGDNRYFHTVNTWHWNGEEWELWAFESTSFIPLNTIGVTSIYSSSVDIYNADGMKIYTANSNEIAPIPPQDDELEEDNEGWLNSIFSGIQSIFIKLSNIPILITNWFSSAFNTVFDWLRDIFDTIVSLPSIILNGIKAIFIPDMEEMKEEFSNLVNTLSASTVAGAGGGSNGGGFGGGSVLPDVEPGEPQDVYYNFNVGSLCLPGLKLVDYSFLKDAVAYFRPIINGFLILLMGLYWYKEFLSFIGQAHNMSKAQSEAEVHQNKGDKK